MGGDAERPRRPPPEFLRQLEAQVREVEIGLETGEWEMRRTRLLLEPEVAGDDAPYLSATPIDELERRHGPDYRLVDGRRIRDLSPEERDALVEYELLQPRRVTDPPEP